MHTYSAACEQAFFVCVRARVHEQDPGMGHVPHTYHCEVTPRATFMPSSSLLDWRRLLRGFLLIFGNCIGRSL